LLEFTSKEYLLQILLGCRRLMMNLD